MIRFRMRWEKLGGHIHVRVFGGKGETLGLCGALVFREEEWHAFRSPLVEDAYLEVLPEEE